MKIDEVVVGWLGESKVKKEKRLMKWDELVVGWLGESKVKTEKRVMKWDEVVVGWGVDNIISHYTPIILSLTICQ